jgi:UDPglucose--hexose-1-phosphate uridylyltransferase
MERRYDPTLGEWRTYTAPSASVTDDDYCRFCPTLDPQRPTDVPADSYQLAVLDDPFPPLSPDPAAPVAAPDGIHQARPAVGASEIVLYSDQHGQGLADLEESHVGRLIDVWADRYAGLGARDEIGYVLIFEDGAADGVSGAHPFGQVHGYPEIPPLIARELQAAMVHQADRGTCLFCDVTAQETVDERRQVAANDSFLAFVPFAPRFGHELHVYSRRHITSLLDCTDPERLALARMLRAVVGAYRRLFSAESPYVMSIHQAPTDDGEWLSVSHLHVEMVPLRALAATVVGAGTFISDMLPERAAADLRAALSGVDREAVAG